MNLIKIHSWHKVVGLWLILSMTMALSLSAAPLKIMMLGDSITEGGGHIPDLPDQNQSDYTQGLIQNPNHIGYRGKLWSLLKEDGYIFDVDLDFVGNRSGGVNYPDSDFDRDHQGTSGFTSKQIKDEIDGWLATAPADIVLLHVGTNDPGILIPIGSANDNADANTTVNNVKKILNSIFDANPNTKVFVARIIEAKRANGFIAGWTATALNDAVSNMVANHDYTANIQMVNQESGAGIRYDPCGITSGDMQPYFYDGTYDFHPNYKGYEKMAQKWFDDMKASGWLPAPSAPVITLLGTATITLTLGDTYTDAGATANDTVDGNITENIVTVSDVNVSAEGNYTVTYDVNDSAGNEALRVIRTVVVTGNKINEWYTYDENVKTAFITPIGESEQSTLMVEDGLEAIFVIEDNTIALRYKINSSGMEAYISADKNGKVKTGFIKNTIDDSTLQSRTLYKAGTNSIMKTISGKVIIETVVKLNKNESIIMGES